MEMWKSAKRIPTFPLRITHDPHENVIRPIDLTGNSRFIEEPSTKNQGPTSTRTRIPVVGAMLRDPLAADRAGIEASPGPRAHGDRDDHRDDACTGGEPGPKGHLHTEKPARSTDVALQLCRAGRRRFRLRDDSMHERRANLADELRGGAGPRQKPVAARGERARLL